MLRASLKSSANVARRFASGSAQTKYATLSNGVTVATEANPLAASSTVGLYLGAGSRSEYAYSNGLSALTTSVLSSVAADGVALSTESTREVNGVVAQTTNDNVVEAGKLLGAIFSKPSEVYEKADLGALKKAQIAAAEALEATPQQMIVSHLNATAYQGYSLGLPVLGSSESVSELQTQDFDRFLQKYLVGSNVVVAASGNIDHDALVDALESSLNVPQGLKPAVKPVSFLGSDIKMRDDTLPKCYVTLAAEGSSLNSPGYYIGKVAAQIFGSFDHNAATAKFTSAKLATTVQEYHIVDKYTHFATSYSDTGLWGFNAEISNVGQVDDFVHFTLKEWNRLSVSVTDAEVARAKQQVKTQLLAELSSTNAVASDIANKILLTGYRTSLTESLEKIDAIKTADVKSWAQAHLWDKDIVISSTGQNEALMDYSRWRNGMSMMRW